MRANKNLQRVFNKINKSKKKTLGLVLIYSLGCSKNIKEHT